MTLINSISARATVITRTAARLTASLVFTILLGISAGGAQAECSGCLCPGNPCKLCPLPPVKNNSPVSDESDTCKKIQEKVAAGFKKHGADERYASLNKSIMECVRNGGDVLMNSRRSQEFPSKHYCKPYISADKANTQQATDPSRKNQERK